MNSATSSSAPSRCSLLMLVLAGCAAGSVELEEQKPPGNGDTADTQDTGGGDDTADTQDTGGDSTGTEDSGVVVAGSIEVSPASADLGVVFVGAVATTALTVANVGEGSVDVTLSVLGGHADAWTADVWTSAPAPGESAVHTLTLTPVTWGDHSVTAVVEDAVSGGRAEVALSAAVQMDADGDGHGSLPSGGDDCDDDDPRVNPAAEEVWYDGVDQDCDGAPDDDQDADGEGVATDCDDLDPSVHTGATDAWYDGIDADCAGNDDYDQDGDGYVETAHVGLPTAGLPDTGHLPGGDCDDTDPTLNPGVTELWYDGIDGDCDGADDYDQDGDGVDVDADCDDLDASVYPGAPETWYDGVDADCAGDDDYDQDGDGVDWPDDCSDTDPTTTGPSTETWNGLDDDCNGYVDDLSVADVASGIVYGDGVDLEIGDHGTLALDADLDGDGAPDLVLATAASREGTAWIVDAATAASTTGLIGDLYDAAIAGDSAWYPIATVSGPFADVDGDGEHDLLVGAQSTSYGYGMVYGFEGGAGLSGPLLADNADASWTGDSDTDQGGMGATGDLDGDGLAEVIIGSARDNYGSGSRDTGSLAVFAGGSFSDSRAIDEADDRIWGDGEYDYLGASLVVADLTGDGRDDLVSGAPGVDAAADDAGTVYVIPGDSGLDWDDFAGDASSASFVGTSDEMELGEDTLPNPGDIDGDGALDLGIGVEAEGAAWVYLAAGARSGTTAVSTAEYRLTGTAADFGSMIVMSSDLDGDGADELCVGADGDDTAFSNAGAVFIFSWSAGWAQDLTRTDASVTLWGEAADDYFGSGGVGGMDLDGDARDDLVVGAVLQDGGAVNGGAAYIVPGR